MGSHSLDLSSTGQNNTAQPYHQNHKHTRPSQDQDQNHRHTSPSQDQDPDQTRTEHAHGHMALLEDERIGDGSDRGQEKRRGGFRSSSVVRSDCS